MASGRAADREDPNKSRRKAARSLDRDPISELHQGQRSDAPHQRAGHMTAPDHFAEAQLNILRRRAPSTYDFCTVRFGGGEPTFAGASRNDQDAPIPAGRGTEIERQGSTQSCRSIDPTSARGRHAPSVQSGGNPGGAGDALSLDCLNNRSQRARSSA